MREPSRHPPTHPRGNFANRRFFLRTFLFRTRSSQTYPDFPPLLAISPKYLLAPPAGFTLTVPACASLPARETKSQSIVSLLEFAGPILADHQIHDYGLSGYGIQDGIIDL